MKDLKTVFSYLNGEWTFEREITCLMGESLAHASGKAKFEKTTSIDELFYHEEGSLLHKLNTASNSFFRDYYYRLNHEFISVYHACGPQNGSFYQNYAFSSADNTLVHTETHKCGQDIYSGVYELLDEDFFSLLTKALGPQKNYLIKTLFKRFYEV